MRIYSKEEARKLFKHDELTYAELAHQHPCCDLPQHTWCVWCDDGVWCAVLNDFTPASLSNHIG